MASTGRATVLCLGLAAAYAATGRLGLELAGYAGSVTLVWPPAGIALAALVLVGRGLWPGVALGAFAVNLLTVTPAVALGIALGSTLGALVGLSVLERIGVEPSLQRARDAAGLFAAAAAFPLVSASVGVASLRLGGVLPAEQSLGALAWWWVGDGVGILLVAPVLLTWLSPRPPSLAVRSRLEGLVLAALLLATSASVFLSALSGDEVHYPFTFAVAPPLVWASVRFGPRGAAPAALATAAFAIAGTLAHLGPFGGYSLQQRLLFLELFVGVLGAMALLLGAEVAERDRAFAALAESHRERLRAEEEARRATEQALESQKLESLGVLAGGVAHDFNNLLAGILANSSYVTESLPAGSRLRPALQDLETLALRAGELTHQMLAYAGGAPLVTHVVDLSALVGEMNVLVASSVSKKARLSFDLARGLPLVECDPAQVRQVVMNLITNASEALGEGEGFVDVATRRGAPGPDGIEPVELEVRDSGCGMDADTRARMFDPFFTTKLAGRGLGLAATLGIVRRHGASLDVETAVGRGTAVRLRLAPSSARASEPDVEARGDWRPEGAILVVDDEEGLRAAVERALTGAGFSVLSASSGREGVALFRERAREVRAVLLDVAMPDLSGAEVLPALRAVRADVPVVVWTGYSEAETAARLRGEKPDAVLFKPSTLREILAGLRAAIERP